MTAEVALVDLLMPRSALVAGPLMVTPPAAPLELPELESVCAPPMPAVLTTEPVAFAATLATSVKLAVVPLMNVAAVQEMRPDAFTAGVVHDQPAGVEIDWKSSDAGSVSVMVTPVALCGPLLVTLMV